MDASALTAVSPSQPNVRPQQEDPLDFLWPNPKFEKVLRYAQEAKSRIWLFYHAAYLEAFGRSAPFRRISDDALRRICVIF